MKHYKINDRTPQPTAAEMEVCERFAKAKKDAAEAEALKDEVQAIVARYGKVATEQGLLTDAESVRWPVPTLKEWETRVQAMEARLKAMFPGAESEQLAAQLEQIEGDAETPGLTAHLRSYHEVVEWMGEMEDFFKATGVTQKACKPMVKFIAFKARPELPAVRKASKN